MERRTQYEQLIAQKLEQAPLPDMADSIWSSVQLELDTLLPDDAGQDKPVPKPKGKGLPGASKLLYVAVPALLITAAWFYFKNRKRHKVQKNIPAIQIPADTAAGDTAAVPVFPDGQRPVNSLNKIKADSPQNKNVFILPGLYPDSSFDPVNPPAAQDSVSASPGVGTVPVKDTASKTPPSKKSRGVKGITDDDYRIKAENRDSAKKDH